MGTYTFVMVSSTGAVVEFVWPCVVEGAGFVPEVTGAVVSVEELVGLVVTVVSIVVVDFLVSTGATITLSVPLLDREIARGMLIRKTIAIEAAAA